MLAGIRFQRSVSRQRRAAHKPDTTGDDVSNISGSLSLALVMVVCALPLGAQARATAAQSPDIVGSWRLESWTLANGNPRCSEEDGEASGQIIYSADGHMSAQLGCQEMDVSDLSPQAAGGAISRRHFSYYGGYTLDLATRTVTHHVLGSSSATFVGSDQVRSFVFEGPDRLVLSPGGRQLLVWLRNR